MYTYSQTSGLDQYESIKKSEISEEEKVLQIERFFTENNNLEASEMAEIYYDFSKWNWIKQSRDESRAKKYAKKVIDICSYNSGVNAVFYKKNLFNLGLFNHNSVVPNYVNALKSFNSLVEVSDPYEKRLGKAYREQGDIYDATGDFQRALENYEKSELIFNHNKNNKELLKTYVNIAATYANLKDSLYVEAYFENLNKIERLGEDYEIPVSSKIKLLLNTGAVHNTVNDFDNSIVFYKDALELAKEINDSTLIATILNNIVVYYKKKKDYLKSEEKIKEGISYVNSNFLLESSFFDNMADLHLAKSEFPDALSNYNNAIGKLLNSTPDPTLAYLPSIDVLKTSSSAKDILDYLIDKTFAWIKYYEATSEIAHLLEAEKTIQLSDQIIDLLYFESREDLSKLFWREKGSELYLKAVAVCHILNKPERAFYFMEKNKGLLLLEKISELKAKLFANIPQTVIDKEYQLISQIKALQSSLLNTDLESGEIEKTKNKIFSCKNNYENFVDSLKTEFPQFSKYKDHIKIVPSNKIQNSLKENELVVEYILGKESGFVILISKKGLELKELNSVLDLYKDIEQFKLKLSKPFTTMDETRAFQAIATRLFKTIFPFDDFQKELNEKKLIVIVEGPLQGIPFEALTISENPSIQEQYLLNHCNIYYKYSYSLDSQAKTISNNNQNKFVGFVASEFDKQYLPALNNDLFEINAISPLFKENLYTGQKAIKHKFLEAYNQNDVIHVSTHGGVEKDVPWLAFYDEKLSFNELYFLEKPKKMVVLSACKSSVGKKERGEGQFSLTRAFINSGAKSVVSTLWDVNEKSSSEIISQFYNNLNSKQSKSVALRSAKREYLELYKNTSQASPYYWSSIILTGNDDPIFTEIVKRSYTTYCCLFFGICFLIFFIYLRKDK